MTLLLSTLSWLLICLPRLVHAASADEWRSRAIYQVLTDRFALSDNSTNKPCNTALANYCGGSWRGITNHLDYIQNMGFTAVWISPITYQVQGSTLDGEAYHGYWQQDLFQINGKFGTKEDLIELSNALHARGMLLMVDVVVNHFGWDGSPLIVDYSTLHPFDTESDFHPPCLISSFSDANTSVTQDCWLGDNTVSLPDLRTEKASVASTYSSWIKELVSNYSIDGLRIDSALNVEPSFFPAFVNASGVFATGETLNGNASIACEYQQNSIGSILDYPTYFPLTAAFSSNEATIGDLVDELGEVGEACSDPTLLGTFSENHDVSRFPTNTDDLSLAANVLTFVLLITGIPIVYYGSEQHLTGSTTANANRQALWLTGYDVSAPLYMQISNLNALRNHAVGSYNFAQTKSQTVYQDPHTVAFFRGSANASTLTVLTNTGANSDAWTLNATTPYGPGTNITEILACTTLVANATGGVSVPMSNGEPRVYFPTSLLKGSGLCGNKLDPTSTFDPSASPTASNSPSQTAKSDAGTVHCKGGGLLAVIVSSVIISSLFII